ncbi:SAM-dependent methyltransferase [Saccharopolyspora dendranthemae]|uniref:S-adenosyl methyltransferase n=1 Tax=Saccharopolyspora dendranthemae TaxID=1181886 RepID=A0A561V924_9PSEU|nr:SAM-dependent methyltransferase [Saccharopolyspora dendranthemae]TWG08131.1 S-adenosyl methyltransferase [Saccharopolyspora dendranthemae]
MNEQAGRLPVEIDTTVAHEARVYDYWLGGKDNFEADRALGDAIAEHIPTIKTMARANRAFVGRAVRYLVRECGIRQFLDIGTGIPTSGNVHEVAQRAEPGSRVVYVDNDPIVLAHARALMTSTEEGATRFVFADLHDPHSILSDPALAETLDLTQPTAVMLVAVLMYFRETSEVRQVLDELMKAVPDGSYLTITHPTADFDPEAMAGVVASAEQSGIPFQPRGRDEVAALFDGLELVEPGVTPVLAWRPDPEPAEVTRLHPEHEVDPRSAYYWAAMGRKG